MCISCAKAFVPGISQGPLPPGGALPVAAVDHHLHIQGPDVTEELRQRLATSPKDFAMFNAELFETRTHADALAALDRAGIASGVLLSMAYTFASPRSTTAAADVAALTRRENAYNVAAARQSGWRLKAFIGINPFWDGALDELHHWRREPGVTGLKLHLSNSRFDAQSALQLERLADVCAIANAAGWSIVIHARGDGDYAPVETARFIEQVLPSAAGALVQIAHAGGGGGIDEAMVEALALYADALEQGAAGTQGLVFDLAVVLVRDAADPHSAALIQRFVQLARRIGLQRFFMGSDWPSVVPPLEHNALSQAQLPFTEDEWRTVLNNRAPYMQEHLS